VEEWVAYHMLLGVDHFYIYDDRSTDDLNAVLAPYVKQGFVSIFYWDHNITVSPSDVPIDPKYTRSQRFAIADCVWNHNRESEWFGIWDVDEFLVLNQSFPSIHSFIYDYLVPTNRDEFHIPMTTFGPSGHYTTPTGLVIENYTWRSNKTMFGYNTKTNKFTGKSLYKSDCAVPEVHWSPHLPDGCSCDYEWIIAEGELNLPPIYLSHYFTKSWSDFESKKKKWGFASDMTEFQLYEIISGEIQDTSMSRFVEPITQIESCIRQK